MATTRIMPMHMNKGKTLLQSLSDRTEYAMNPDKTDGGLLISSYECDQDSVEVDFLLAKEQYRAITGREPKKGKDVIAYQLRQSFYPGEITPEEANRMGYDLAMQFTGGQHQFIVAKHIDKAHVHNHIIFNSTTLDCTHKFNNFLGSSDTVRDMSDRMCLEKGYSIITEPEKKGKAYAEWNAEKKGNSWKAKLKKTVEEILPGCRDFEDFLRQMQESGYEVKRGKYISLRAPGQKRFTRLKTLGDEYAEDAIRVRLAGTKSEKSKSAATPGKAKPMRQTDREVDFLIDIEKKMAEGKGEGYKQWAKKHNLQQTAKAFCILREEDIHSAEEMDARVDAAATDFELASDQLKATEAEIRELKELKKHIIDYGRTRDVYAEYRKRDKPDDFFEAHRAEIQIHLAAKNAFEAYKPKKIPKLKALNTRLDELFAQQKTQYERYREARENMQKWQAIQQNIDRILDRGTEKEKHRGESR